MRLSVIGTGYLGAVYAACMAELGFDVVGVDIDARRVDALTKGDPPFYEPDFEELLRRALDRGRLRFTTDYASVENADVHFLCVGTPQRADGLAADLTNLFDAARSLAFHLPRPCLVVGKSTVPVGTATRVTTLIHELAPAGTGVEVAWSPEFVREGFAVTDTLKPDRVVVGVQGASAEPLMRTINAAMIDGGSPFLVMDLPSAELVKVAANAFLATKISFINAMAEICDAVGADVTALADAIGHDARIGRRFLNAGIGFGGGCLPKDIRAFTARAAELGVSDAAEFLRQIDVINDHSRVRAVELARDSVGGSFAGTSVAVLGAAFKPDSDDIRDSPALDIAIAISSEGGDVRVHDPRALVNVAKRYPRLAVREEIGDALAGADLVLHLTEWPEYRDLDPARLRPLVRHARLVDGRNALDAERWRSAGWQVRALGRPAGIPIEV